LKHLLASILIKEKPVIDRIAVTYGPGLEPALWVGVNAAKALGILWNIPVVGVNHMEGHILGSLLPSSVATSDFKKLAVITYPALTLLISGGHTELVVVKEVEKKYVYEIVGRTKDDAVGEAFDKVARLLGLLYPGGPEISRLAEAERKEHKRSGNGHTNEHIDEHIKERPIILPRPMIHSPDLNFSFSGLKTSVLYLTRELQKENKIAYNTEELTDRQKSQIAREFEDAVTDVLIHKTEKAIDHYGIASLLIGGGVIANSHIVQALTQLAARYDIPIYIPPDGVSGDNALMIALAGAFAEVSATADSANLRADGNLSLGV
jgi:N6-L-threonylcarbamoyladenine synthase